LTGPPALVSGPAVMVWWRSLDSERRSLEHAAAVVCLVEEGLEVLEPSPGKQTQECPLPGRV